MSRMFDERAERHQRAGRAADLEPQDVVAVEAEALVGLGADLVDAAEEVEVVDVGRAEIDLQRVEDVRQRHVQHLRLGAVDLEVDLRRVGAEGREHAGEVGS